MVPRTGLTRTEKKSPSLSLGEKSSIEVRKGIIVFKKPKKISASETLIRSGRFLNGDKGNRTPDLLNANQALYHLSYTPMQIYDNTYERVCQYLRENITVRFLSVLKKIFLAANL